MAFEEKGKIWELIGLALFPILGSIYGWLNTSSRHAVEIGTPLDSYIPFLPVFIIPYIIWYIYIFGALLYFWRKNRIVYWKTLLMIGAGELICFIIYYFFQTTVARPVLQGDTIFSNLTAFIYAHDEPVNCFPSIHVLTTSIIMLSFLQVKKTGIIRPVLIHSIGTFIILSTLFVKQHVVYDLAASILLSLGLNVLAYKVRLPVRHSAARRKSKKARSSEVLKI